MRTKNKSAPNLQVSKMHRLSVSLAAVVVSSRNIPPIGRGVAWQVKSDYMGDYDFLPDINISRKCLTSAIILQCNSRQTSV